MIFAGPRKILDLFSKIASVWFNATFPGGAHQHGSKPSIERHGNERSLAITRNTFDTNALRINALVRLQIIKTARGAPAPRPQRTPILRLSSLALICKSNDPLRQT